MKLTVFSCRLHATNESSHEKALLLQSDRLRGQLCGWGGGGGAKKVAAINDISKSG